MRGTTLDRALAGLAVGRIALGALGRFAPVSSARMFGLRTEVSPELDYMTRVFGARAFALGTGYLTSSGDARRRWQRLAFVCDVSDTLAGAAALRRGGVPRATAAGLTAMTGAYAVVGAVRIARDVAGGGGDDG